MSSHRMRAMMVADHFVVCTGVAAMINSKTETVAAAEARNGREAIDLFRQHQPDVTLMDLRIPLLSGVEAIAAIVKEFPKAKIIVLSTFGGDEDIFKALQAGARAYFLKDVKGNELVGAIRSVHAGQRLLPPELAARLAERIPRSELS